MCFNNGDYTMDIKALFFLLTGFNYRDDEQLVTYVFITFKQIITYLLSVLLTVVLITLLAFGYVPIEGGGINNPAATIAYVWGHGLLVVSLPILGIFLLLHAILIIKARRPKLWIYFGVIATVLGLFNILISLVDLVTIMTPWFIY